MWLGYRRYSTLKIYDGLLRVISLDQNFESDFMYESNIDMLNHLFASQSLRLHCHISDDEICVASPVVPWLS
jgi:hypothetical protein